jgi:hypothetical protein
MNSFSKGHKAAVVLLEDNDLPHLPGLLSILPPTTLTRTVFVLLTDNSPIDLVNGIVEVVGANLSVHSMPTVNEIIRMISEALSDSIDSGCELPVIITMPSNACPVFYPEPRTVEKEPCSPEEIEEIREICLELGVRMTEEKCFIELPEGTLTVGFAQGTVNIRPALCSMCTEDCKKNVNICIVGQDPGWSSGTLGKRALLTMAKIVGLARRELPQHVEMQISRAAICRDFLPSPDIPEELIMRTMNIVQDAKHIRTRIPLLELAQQRVAEGRLSKSDFDMLKGKLQQLSDAVR